MTVVEYLKLKVVQRSKAFPISIIFSRQQSPYNPFYENAVAMPNTVGNPPS